MGGGLWGDWESICDKRIWDFYMIKFVFSLTKLDKKNGAGRVCVCVLGKVGGGGGG